MNQRLELISKRRRQGCYAVLLAVFLVFVQINTCAAVSRNDKEALNSKARQEAQQREREEQKKDVFLAPEVPKQANVFQPDETPGFFIREIRIDGDERRRFSWLDRQVRQYENQRIGKHNLAVVVRRLENALITKGFVTTRLLIPEQNLSKGVLTLRLVPGYVGKIRFVSSGQQADWRSAFPCRPGDILNLRALEQGLEQMKRLSSQDVSFQLVPGETIGVSDVLVTLRRSRPDRAVLSIDDSGTPATGRLQSSFSYSVDNLLGRNDFFQMGVNTDAAEENSEKGTRGMSFYWSVPDGWWTYSLMNWTSRYKQSVPIFGAAIEYSGRSDTWELGAERMLYRTQHSKTSLELKLRRNSSHSYINDIGIDNQRRKTAAAAIALRHRRYEGRAVWDVRTEYRHGTGWFNAQDDKLVSAGEYTSRYGIWTAEIDLSKPFKLGRATGRYNGALKGQYTNSRLYAGEYFSIGNRYTIRGFDGEETLMGENGWLWRNEFSFPIGKRSEWYCGLDYGRVSAQQAAALAGTDICGAVVGVRTPLGAAGTLDFFVGWPLKAPDAMRCDNPTLGFQYAWQI